MLLYGSNGFGWHSFTRQRSHAFQSLSHTFAQAEMSSEENELQHVHSDLLWETQPFRFRLHEKGFESVVHCCTTVFTPSLVDCNFPP